MQMRRAALEDLALRAALTVRAAFARIGLRVVHAARTSVVVEEHDDVRDVDDGEMNGWAFRRQSFDAARCSRSRSARGKLHALARRSDRCPSIVFVIAKRRSGR